MRIAVIGAGAVGAGFGVPLAEAGGDVTFIARGAHLAAMRRNGLRIERDSGSSLLHPVQATDDPATVVPVDIVLLAVKNWDVERAGAAIRPLVAAGGAVIPLQNGVDAGERLLPILGAHAVMGGTVQISGTITEPGVIRQNGAMRRIAFGKRDGHDSARGRNLAARFAAAGVESVFTPRIDVEIWVKFIFLVAISGATAAARRPVGVLREDPDGAALIAALMRETEAVGRAEGVAIPDDAVDTWLAFVRQMPAGIMASMANDLLGGNRLELPWLAGKVVALGRTHRVPTPANAVVNAVLKPYVNGVPG